MSVLKRKKARQLLAGLVLLAMVAGMLIIPAMAAPINSSVAAAIDLQIASGAIGGDSSSETWYMYGTWGVDSNHNGIADIFEVTYTLFYDFNGGVDGPNNKPFNLPGNTVKLDTASPPARLDSNNNDMMFLGWTTDNTVKDHYVTGEAALVPQISDGVTFGNFDITVYAAWAADFNNNNIPDVYEDGFGLTYDPNGGTGAPVDSTVYAWNDTVALDSGSGMSNGSYIFVGWTLESIGSYSSVYTFGEASLLPMLTTTATFTSTDITANAVWSTDANGNGIPDVNESGSFVVTYDPNGGTGSQSDSSNPYTTGDSVTVLNKNDMAKSGHSFIGWNTKADGTGTAYAPGSTFTISENTVLYAQWRPDGGTWPVITPDPRPTDPPEVKPTLEKDKHIVYLNGYPDSSVQGDGNITRAEAAAIFFRLLSDKDHSDKNATVKKQFSDVSGGEWFGQYVNYLASIGVVSGYPDGSFQPNGAITRAEFTAIAAKFDKLADTGANVFNDVPSSHWAVSFINSAYNKGWVNGYNDGTFKPDQYITRGKTATIVNNMLNRAIDDASLAAIKNPYNDIDAMHWAYAAIIEASVAHEYTRDNDGVEHWKLGGAAA